MTRLSPRMSRRVVGSASSWPFILADHTLERAAHSAPDAAHLLRVDDMLHLRCPDSLGLASFPSIVFPSLVDNQYASRV